MTSERNVHGVISWKSIGNGLLLVNNPENPEPRRVKDYMEPAIEVRASDPLLKAVRTMGSTGYLLVRDRMNIITGIVTSSDLSDQFILL